jgi:mxaA protein
MRGELETFFGLSRQVYFEPKFQLQNAFGAAQNPHQWLVEFTRRCRDCERGLTPEPIKMGA